MEKKIVTKEMLAYFKEKVDNDFAVEQESINQLQNAIDGLRSYIVNIDTTIGTIKIDLYDLDDFVSAKLNLKVDSLEDRIRVLENKVK